MEPLGQSQVLAYLERLSPKHKIHLISFEKHTDISVSGELSRMEERLKHAGIAWHRLCYHKRPTGLATAYDILRGILTGLRVVKTNKADIIHARSYVPSVIALALKKLTGAKYIFDMRGFWADERVDGGIWPEGGRLYRVAKWFERKFLLNTDHIVSLTNSAVAEIKTFGYLGGKMPPVTVIPTCVDLDKFVLRRGGGSDKFVLGYVGSAGTWYLFEYVVDAFKILLSHNPGAYLVVVNRGEQEYIRKILERSGISPDRYEVKAVNHAAVPIEMSRMDAGVFFIRPQYSKQASAPTKLGEFLACGIPCISNTGVGDMTDVLRSNNVGIAIDGFSSHELESGIIRLISLAGETGMAQQCREVAKSHFSLIQGVKSYDEIYRGLL